MSEAYRNYDSDTLKKIQKVQTSILSDFAEICEKHGWTWFVFGGTALGTVRHEGFIPWDDDVDVIMPRRDYEEFISSFDETGRNLILHTGNEKDYVLTFAKMTRKGTVFLEKHMCEHRYISGIYIDIFAYDCTPEDIRLQKKQLDRTWLYKTLCMSNRYRKYMDINDGSARGLAVSAFFGLTHTMMKLFRISKESIYRKYLNAASQYNDSGSRLYMNFADNAPKNEIFAFSDDDIFPLRKMKFEDIYVNVMNNYDSVLTKQYGNYMTLPPEEDRQNHAPERIEFGDESGYTAAVQQRCD